MKLSSIKGERTFDVLVEVMDPIFNIAQDEDVQAVFGSDRKRPEGMTDLEFGIYLMKEHLPKIVANHKDDFILILSTLEGVSRDEYIKKLTFPKLIKDATELLNDPTFRGFLF